MTPKRERERKSRFCSSQSGMQMTDPSLPIPQRVPWRNGDVPGLGEELFLKNQGKVAETGTPKCLQCLNWPRNWHESLQPERVGT